MTFRRFALAFCLLLLAQSAQARPPAPTLYVVGYAHLDTQWRWEFPQVIGEYLPKTMRDNFDLLARYPHYIFNFTGANRYRLMKEYYPEDFARLKQWVAAGRWFPAGSCMEESDQLMPSAESLFRQVLYGNLFFREEFHKASREFMQPDSFGFPASLPSILAHSGLLGFSTQKLVWGSAAPGGPGVSPENTPVGIPFNLGFWEGPDGRGLLAALNPGGYTSTVASDLSCDPEWVARLQRDQRAAGLGLDLHYYGVGDIGGAPLEQSVKLMEATVTKGKAFLPPPRQPNESALQYGHRIEHGTGPEVAVGRGPLQIVSATAEQLFLALNGADTSSLPRYQGELLLTQHSAGSLTSQAYHKRWNRRNELLAAAAEEASTGAELLGGLAYPREALRQAWTLVLGGQFHDTLAGTCTPRAYTFAWNDDVIAMNRFAGMLTQASQAIAATLDTRVQGIPVVVFNPLNIAREDVVEADLTFPDGVRVVGPDGRPVPAQLAGPGKVLFLARVPSVGFAVYDVQGTQEQAAGSLVATPSSLENWRYRLKLDPNGDVASIFDKTLQQELLRSPMRLAFETEKPKDWPAWNMDWEDQQKPPRGYLVGPARVTVVENGPVRVALKVERQAQGSRFEQTIRLSAGEAGNRVEFSDLIDWRTSAAALKVTFPLSFSNPRASYNCDIGTSARGNNEPRKYEVPAHQWFDLTDQSGRAGVTVLSDCKYGSDKPDDQTLRLTLLYTPGLGSGGNAQYRYNAVQTTQDWGRHQILYGLASHASDWRESQSDWQAYRLNQPLLAFSTSPHPGQAGKTLSLLTLNDSRVRVLAFKKAEGSDELIVRLVEMSGMQAPEVRLRLAAPILGAREVNAQESPVGPAQVVDQCLVTSLGPNQPRTFALKLAGHSLTHPPSAPLQLAYDRATSSQHGTAAPSGFDAEGKALPSEMLPAQLSYGAVDFHLGPGGAGRPDALVCRGQTLPLPQGDHNRLYLLAASAEGDQKAVFRVGEQATELTIQSWGGFLGQWDTRQWTFQPTHYLKEGEQAPPMEFTGQITPGYVKTAPLAWFASHCHRPDGSSEPYAYSYLFAYALDLLPGAHSLTLPNNDHIRILAATATQEGPGLKAAQPLYDTLDYR